MARRSRGTAFDISIRGDQLEHNRIMLEHNLQNTEVSFRLESTSDDEQNDHHPTPRRRQHAPSNYKNHNHDPDSSVEYPRHISEPSLPDFPSFAHRSRDFGEPDVEPSPGMRGWSYRIGDDEEGIHPYAGEHTVSTAAHHASAVTLSAGLGGGRGARREISLSGAEYDPDRPLQAMIAGVNSKHSMLDLESKQQMTYDPIVVENTAELDRLLESGHTPALPAHTPMRSHSVRPASPLSSATSSTSESEPAQQAHPVHPSTRPKLTDHLRHVSFSPKRPRSAQGVHTSVQASPRARPGRSTYTVEEPHDRSTNMPTPRPARRANNNFPPYAQQPEVRLQPATPSTAGSRFTRMARGINKELEAAQKRLKEAAQRPRAEAPAERNPFHDDEPAPAPAPATSLRNPPPRKSALRDVSSNNRIHLPDVTGLTAAVESPARPGLAYRPYRADERPREVEARLVQMLSGVQRQLQGLEEENGISRRRVRELEMELEEARREVGRERRRLEEREERERERSWRREESFGRGKGKGKTRMGGGLGDLDDERVRARYKEAVDEKKALEELITSLRSHLTRLTAELASHQALLAELRRLRDEDAQALKEKGAEIVALKEEVQRLAGEVEVLRGVVEEGLKERRASREGVASGELSQADLGMSRDLEESDEEGSGRDDLEESEEEEEAEPFDPQSIALQASSMGNVNANNNRGNGFSDKTMQTDHATLGSSNFQESQGPGRRLVDEEELERIAAEVEERRSNRSSGSIGGSPVRQQPLRQRERERTPEPQRRTRRPTVEDATLDYDDLRPRSRNANANAEPSTSRPVAPTPAHAARFYDRERPRARELAPEPEEPETPFPQIRGDRLERLFFSAPEHNAKTCTVCYRRRGRAHGHGGGPSSPSWARPVHPPGVKAKARAEEPDVDEDEGYEGSEGVDDRLANKGKGKQREKDRVGFSDDPNHWRQVGRRLGLPPQTVLARVIRELEDDFTHYKSVYVELADQYKVMDAVSDVRRRNMLARHLREVVDILEQKGDQIASLYELLRFKDKPEGVDSEKGRGSW